MKCCRLCSIEKPLEDFAVHKATRDGRNSYCKSCQRGYSRAWYAAKVAYRPPRPPRIVKGRNQIQRDSYRKNADKNRARALAAYYAKHDANKQKMLHRQKQNRRARTEYQLARNASKRGATPDCGNRFFIREAYALATLREKVCGGKWHVDHIVPPTSKVVCGLHVEYNLAVIPGVENLRKSNRYWPDMP